MAATGTAQPEVRDYTMTRYLKDGDILSAAALAVLAAYIIQVSSQWTILGPEGPGPGFFPLGYGILMLGCALGLIVMTLIGRGPVKPAPEETADRAGTIDAFVTWGALAASVPLMSLFGFIVGFGLVIFFMVKVVFGRSLLAAVATAAAIVLSLHIVLPVLLGSPLPGGRWWNC
jgi:putative tricarboxylic transport membrane protein